jgi:hypothetical protein
VQREESVDDVVLEVQQAVGPRRARPVYPRAEAEQSLDALERLNPHAEIDHDEIGISRQIHCLTINRHSHLCLSVR